MAANPERPQKSPGQTDPVLDLLFPAAITHQRASARSRDKSRVERDELETSSPVESLPSACYGLVVLDHTSAVIRMVHKSTEDYFLDRRRQYFPDAQRDIALACITYLSFDALNDIHCKSERALEALLQDESNALLGYAAQNGDSMPMERETEPLSERSKNQFYSFLVATRSPALRRSCFFLNSGFRDIESGWRWR